MAFRLGAEAYCLVAALRRHARQQVVEYVDEVRFSTSTGRWIQRQRTPQYLTRSYSPNTSGVETQVSIRLYCA